MCRNPPPFLQHSKICPDVGRHVTIDKVIPHTFPTYEIVQQSDAADGVGHQLVEQSESTLVRGLGLWRDFKKRLITKDASINSFLRDDSPSFHATVRISMGIDNEAATSMTRVAEDDETQRIETGYDTYNFWMRT
ncbi:hypothetical protein Tco_1100227 [Tanacetum coccineum]